MKKKTKPIWNIEQSKANFKKTENISLKNKKKNLKSKNVLLRLLSLIIWSTNQPIRGAIVLSAGRWSRWRKEKPLHCQRISYIYIYIYIYIYSNYYGGMGVFLGTPYRIVNFFFYLRKITLHPETKETLFLMCRSQE